MLKRLRRRNLHTTVQFVLPPTAKFSFFFSYMRPVLSSSKALGLTARSLHECCRAQCRHACVPRGENLDLCLQITLVHGGAVGTATPKQPKINLVHV